jgi:HD-like signal output (HDOD) protein
MKGREKMVSLWQRLFGSPTATANKARANAGRSGRPTKPAPVAAPMASRAKISELYYRLLFGFSEADSPGVMVATDEVELATLTQLKARVDGFDLSTLDPLPAPFVQQLRAPNTDEDPVSEFAARLKDDPSMIDAVLAAASCMNYQSTGPVSNLQQAVVLLGREGVHRVLTKHVIQPLLLGSSPQAVHSSVHRLVWSHAERCAHACAWLGKNSDWDGFEAYLTGMICQVGSIEVAGVLGALMPEPAQKAVSVEFLDQCAQLGVQLSTRIARHWELPDSVIAALAENENSASKVATSVLGKSVWSSHVLAMAHVLEEHDRRSLEPDFSKGWPEGHTPALLARCQKDLRKYFPTGRLD